MSDAELWSAWRFWMAIAAVLVLVAAALLVTILVTARRILAEAVRALHAAEAIQRNTAPIWQLAATRDVAGQLQDVVRSLEAKGALLARALDDHTVRK